MDNDWALSAQVGDNAVEENVVTVKPGVDVGVHGWWGLICISLREKKAKLKVQKRVG